MMEKKLDAKEARVQIWEELLRVAKPDSKFSWQFSEFICDYEGSEKGTALLTATDMYKNAKVIFITPDNNLETLREQAFRDKKTVVMTNYGITRGFFLIRPEQIPEIRRCIRFIDHCPVARRSGARLIVGKAVHIFCPLCGFFVDRIIFRHSISFHKSRNFGTNCPKPEVTD